MFGVHQKGFAKWSNALALARRRKLLVSLPVVPLLKCGSHLPRHQSGICQHAAHSSFHFCHVECAFNCRGAALSETQAHTRSVECRGAQLVISYFCWLICLCSAWLDSWLCPLWFEGVQTRNEGTNLSDLSKAAVRVSQLYGRLIDRILLKISAFR